MPGNRRKDEAPGRLTILYFLVGWVLALDQVSKLLALRFLGFGSSYPVIPSVFHLTLVHNTGIAFGLLRQHPFLLLLFITLSLILLVAMSRQLSQSGKLAQWAFSLILGGALGNWVDRLCYGYVVDFLDFRIWPVFNLADTAISIGTGLYLLHWLRQEKGRK